ncbi:alpha/beta fold hydrolase [Eisenibacter elegans]|uniref:alpha/beta fold hydrolase n=1 Tax=Eisenibacter elegans TaxID=997 RepID=UPI000555C442|nr:alpha/beta hydrolase [Eisenibacter elegans]
MKKKLAYFFLILIALLAAALLWFAKADIPVETLKERYTNEASQFVRIQGMDVHYRVEGQGAHTVVLLHGTGASLHTWEPWVDSLKADFKVVTLDLPAFGLTGPHPKADYSLDAYVAFLYEFTQALKLESFHLGGNSLGGGIAWNYTLAHPEQVLSLVLVDASGYPSNRKSPWVFRLARQGGLNQIVRYVTPKFFFKKNLLDVYADPNKVTDALVERYYELGLREGNRQAFIDRSKTTYTNRADQIPNIRQPTLIQWGREDRWIPLEHGERFAEDLPNARLVVYDNAGHVPMEEIPAETAADVKRFLKAQANLK